MIIPPVVPYSVCKTIPYIILMVAMLVRVTNSDQLIQDPSNVSCHITTKMQQQQNVTINPKIIPNSTVELRKNCENIDVSCTCDSPQIMRCHNTPTGNLNKIIRGLANSIDLNIPMMDWNLPGLEVFPKNIFRDDNGNTYKNLHLNGLFISSNGTLHKLEDGTFLGLREELNILGLSDNNLGPEISQEIFSLRHLIRLDVSKNNISQFRPILNQATPSLNYLDISYNNLNSINDINTTLFPQSLCTLKASHNKLSINGLSGADFAQIGYLDLSNNRLSGNLTGDIFNSGGGKQIQNIYLDWNQLHYIGRNAFCGLPMLEYLQLSHNNIDRLDKESFKCHLNKLSYIDLSHNQILDITRGLFEPLAKSLRSLFLAHNHLQVLDSTFTPVPLQRLRYLDLQNNDIIKVEPQSLQSLPNLDTLLLTGKLLIASLL